MSSINKALLIGNLGHDPELTYTPNGSAVCKLSLATTRTKNDKNGQRLDETEWHRVTVWGKQAESCSKYLSKGRQVYIEGRIQTRSYEGKDGVKRYSTEIVAEKVQFLGGKGEASQSHTGAPFEKNTGAYEAPAIHEDEIPF